MEAKQSDAAAHADILSDYMTEEQAAAALRKSVRTLRRWHTLREGPPRTLLGREILYRRDAVREWIRSREQAQVAA